MVCNAHYIRWLNAQTKVLCRLFLGQREAPHGQQFFLHQEGSIAKLLASGALGKKPGVAHFFGLIIGHFI
jgi:hypothetical protein